MEKKRKEKLLIWNEIKKAAPAIMKAGGNAVEILIWSQGKTLDEVQMFLSEMNLLNVLITERMFLVMTNMKKTTRKPQNVMIRSFSMTKDQSKIHLKLQREDLAKGMT